MLSQNGYGGVATYGDPLLVSNPTIPGTDIKVLGGLRKGPVAEILLYTLGRINREVRPFRSQEQGFWGYNYRPIRGATTLSNHASGTAADFLAADLPLGVEPTRLFTPAELAALRRIAADLDGLVRFGAFYDGRKDAMHIEAIADEHALAAFMDRLGAEPASTQKDEDDMAQVDQKDWKQVLDQVNTLYEFLSQERDEQGNGYARIAAQRSQSLVDLFKLHDDKGNAYGFNPLDGINNNVVGLYALLNAKAPTSADPAQVASAVAAAIPADLAQRVVDELQKRLTS